MKTLITCSLYLFLMHSLIAQNQGWSLEHPFGKNVFIENKGQFDLPANKKLGKILYCSQQDGISLYWTQQGLTYKITEHYLSEKEKEEMKTGGDPDAAMEKAELRYHFLKVEWPGANPFGEIISEEPVPYYFTYVDPSDKSGSSGLKASGFRKLTYKNIYPNIDLQYELPERGGVKYSFVVHPGGDVNSIKVQYSGADKLNFNKDGEVEVISEECGTYLEHGLHSYYENGDVVNSFFTLKKNMLGFDLSEYDKTRTLIIDPWVSMINFPISLAPYNLSIKACKNVGYDVMYDNAGNVWVYGGGEPLNLAKYNSAGALQWVYSSTLYAPDLIGDADVNKNSGTAYISEGFYGTGAHIVKVDAAGNPKKTFAGNNHNAEISRIRVTCSGKLITTGGGVGPPTGQPVPWQVCTVDTNLNSMTGSHITSSQNGDHDVNLMALDPTGNFMYVNFNYPAPYSADYLNNNEMHKVPVTAFTPSTWINPGPIYAFQEKNSMTYAGFSSGFGYRMNMFNGMVCGNGFLYTYNGDTLKQWDKNNGLLIKQVVTPGKRYWTGGIDLDMCENVYVSVGNKVEKYDAGLNLITTYNLPDTSCYDLKVDKLKNLLYATGNGYVCAIAIPAPPPIQLTTSSIPATCTCNGTASVTIAGGCNTSVFNYFWMPGGQTTSTITGLCAGTYTVIAGAAVTCAKNIGDTAIVVVTGSGNPLVTLNHTNTTCANSSGSVAVNVTAGNPPYSYAWSPAGGTTAIATGLSAGTYSVIITDSNGCSRIDTVSVFSSGSITATASSATVCAGQNATLVATGGTSYSWSNGATTASITPATTVAASYSVIVSSGTCIDTAYATLSVNPSPTATLGNDQTLCPGQSATLDAGNSGANYIWSNGASTQSIEVSGTGTYWVIVGINNCFAKDTLKTFIPPAIKLSDTSFCSASRIVLDPGPGATSYLWSNGSVSQTLSVETGGSYWVEVTYGNCKMTDTATISGDGTGGALYVPNAFTPNGDNLNEIFSAKGVGIADFSMSIFDRWGNMLFASTDINKGWDGKVEGGHYTLKEDGNNVSQEDVYIWKIDYTTQCYPKIIKKEMGIVSVVK